MEVVVEGRKPFRFQGYTCPYKKDFILQAECMESSKGVSLVVTDVLVAPWGSSGNFISRWRWLENVYEAYPNKFPFMLQQWHRLGTPGMNTLLNHAQEGLVIQGVLASPSAIVQGAGSARYIKRRWTVERMCDGMICEYDLEGKYVRDRPDRKKPNPPHVISRIENAITYEAFCVYAGANKDVVSVRKQIEKHMREGRPVAEWSQPECVWFYMHRCDPYLQYHCGVSSVMSYRLAITDRFAKEALKTLSHNEMAVGQTMTVEEYTPSFGDDEPHRYDLEPEFPME